LLNREEERALSLQKRSQEHLIEALDDESYKVASDYVPFCEKIAGYRKMLQSFSVNLSQTEIVVLLMTSWFLLDLIRYLTKGQDEEICYVTGPVLGDLHIPTRICGIEQLDAQSPVYARGNPRACSDALIELHEHGNKVLVMAHSHPGQGAGATGPSSTDYAYMRRIQETGAMAIGIIVTRSNHVRFFTSSQQFEVHITGNGVTHEGNHVYHIEEV